MKTCLTLLMLASFALIAGCGGPTTLYVRGLEPLNVNEKSESTSVDIRIFQLKDDAAFMNKPFDQLWENKGEILGADKLTDPKQITVYGGPATAEPMPIELGDLNKDCRFIGIMALYPKSDGKGSQRVVVAASDAGSVTFELTGYRIEIKK
jgi:type VI secretion system VasD/TssJ family lipoprotein